MNPIFLKNDSYFDEPCRVVTNETLDRWKKHTHNEIPALEGDLYMWSIKSIIFKLFKQNHLTQIIMSAVLVANMVGADAYAANMKEIHSSGNFNALVPEMNRVFAESAKLSMLPARMARALRLPAWSRFERSVDRVILGGKYDFYVSSASYLTRIRTASSLVLDLLPYSRGGKGMLEKFLSAGMELKDVVRIVADLILAAGDTVRLILASKFTDFTDFF